MKRCGGFVWKQPRKSIIAVSVNELMTRKIPMTMTKGISGTTVALKAMMIIIVKVKQC